MAISVNCDCGKAFKLRDELAGKRAKCPVCNRVFQVPIVAVLADTLSDSELHSDNLADDLANDPFLTPLATATTLRPAIAAGGFNPEGTKLLWVGVGIGGGVALVLILICFAYLSMKAPAQVTSASPATANAPTAPAPVATSLPAPKTAPPPPPSSNLPPPAPVAVWNVKVDAPAEPVEWPEQPAFSIPLISASSRPLFSEMASPFVVLGMSFGGGQNVRLWDLVNNREVGKLQDKIERVGSDYALSPDGNYLAAKAQVSGNNSMIRLWSFKTGKFDQDLQCDDAKLHLKWFEFVGANRLVVYTNGSENKKHVERLRVWELPNSRIAREITLDKSIQEKHFAISPGGRYLAAFDGRDTLFVYDLDQGELAGKMSLPDVLNISSIGTIQGLSFRPDGRQLGMISESTSTRVIFLDIEKGELADQFEIAGRLPAAVNYKGEVIEWLGEKGWCLFGASIVDRSSRKVVWNLELPLISRSNTRRTLPGGWISAAGTGRDYRLTTVPIPWHQIEAGLAAMREDSTAYLKPGGKVSLSIRVEELRFGTPEDTSKRLAEIFRQRFKVDQIEIAENQPMVLNVRYRELEGETLEERKGFSGPSTGRTIQATKSVVSLDLSHRDKKASVWSHEFTHDPRTALMHKEFSDAAARDSTFSQLLYSLAAIPIPYYVPKEGKTGSIPGVTMPPE